MAARSARHPWTIATLALIALLLGAAHAQMGTYQSTPFGFSVGYPTAWLGSEVPGAQMAGSRELVVGGQQAAAIDFVGPGLTGAIVYLLHDATLYTFTYIGLDESLAPVRAVFEGMVASFSLF